MVKILQYAVYGLTAGGLLLLATLGFTLVRKVDGFLNIAHAEMIAFAAFFGWFLNTRLGWNFFLAAAVAIVATVLLGLLIQQAVFSPMRPYGVTIILIASIGVAFILQGLIQMGVGSGTFLYDIPLQNLVKIGPISVSPYEGIVLLVALAATAGLHLLLTRTSIGRRVRAVSADPGLAENRGVPLQQTSRVVWILAGLTAGLAGVALGSVGTLTTNLAFEQILLIVSVAIFAGFGSLLELLVAAVLVGIGMKMSLLVLPSEYQNAVPFVIIILVLLLRPQGLTLRRSLS